MYYPRKSLDRRTQWLLLTLCILVLAGMFAASLWYERTRLLNELQERLTAQVKVVDANIVRQLEGVNNGLLSVVQDLGYFQGKPELMSLRLKALSNAMPGVRTLNIQDARGITVASNREELLGRDFSFRDYFRMVIRSPDPNALYLPKPYQTVLGVYSLNLVRFSGDTQGQPSHVVSATLDPDFFKVLLKSVLYADDVWVGLAHIDGPLVVYMPYQPGLEGVDLNQPGSMFRKHLESGQEATYQFGKVKATGEWAWMAQQTISAPELGMRGALTVSVGRHEANALKEWRVLAAVASAVVAFISIISVTALWLTHRRADVVTQLLDREEKKREQAEAEVRHMAFYDHLTQLPNRRLLQDRMKQLLAASIRHGRLSALLFMDLDGFKQLNDTHGHDNGDQMLISVARRLQAELRQEDTAARWAGDEFVVMLSELSGDAEEARRSATLVADKILHSLRAPHDLNGLMFGCTVSVGVTLFGDKDEALDDILKRADLAMYEAKETGRDQCRFRA
jgi:diguanylate cyclase (GGDEF)-like protein